MKCLNNIKVGVKMIKIIQYNNNTISIDTNNKNIIYWNNKPVKVNINKGYSFKINKKSIASDNGSISIYNLIEDCINHKFAYIWVDTIASALDRITSVEK